MLSSISPLGERARASRWWLTAAWYVFGSVLGGASVGALAGLVGWLVPESVRAHPVTLAMLALLMLLGLVLDLGLGGAQIPSWRRQVAESWLGRYRGWVVGVGFGAQLGFGLVTIITSTTTYAMVLLAVWGGRPDWGVAIGVTFGVVRALPLLAMRGVQDAQALAAVFWRLEAWSRPVNWAARTALGVSAGTLLTLAMSVGWPGG